MTTASTRRLEAALAFAEYYASLPDVRAIGCAGSVARGRADSHSDIDILVFWSSDRAELGEEGPLAGAGGTRFSWSGVRETGDALEQYFVDGLKVDVGHRPLRQQKKNFARLLQSHEISPELLKEMAILGDLVPLHGKEEIARIRSEARTYPPELRAVVVESLLPITPPFYLRLCLRRGDLLGFASILVDIAGRALSILAAINGIYVHPGGGLKGIIDRLREVEIPLTELGILLEQLVRMPSETSVPALVENLESLLALVDRHVNAASTARARHILRLEISEQP